LRSTAIIIHKMAVLTSIVLSISIFISLVAGLWPEPTTFKSGTSVLWLSPHVEFKTSSGNASSGHYRRSVYVALSDSLQSLYSQTFFFSDSEGGSSGSISEQNLLQSAIKRTQKTITSTKFVPWKFYSRTVDFEPNTGGSYQTISTVQINQQGSGAKDSFSAADFFAGDESYSITISEAGAAELKSKSTLGTIRALQTFEQLFYAHSSNFAVYTPLAPLSITDSPKWPYRGLNLDISRNAFAPSDVMRTIDAMATCKMSRLHLHATDAQSWPIEIPALPTLAEKGAYRTYLTWSPDDVREIQIYGLQRGISVFLEIDMPGHTGAIANAFPDLIAAFNESDWSTFAAEPPSGSLKLNSPAVYSFLHTLFSDLLPRVSPYTTYFHNGGDEVNKNAFLLDDTVKSNSSAVLQPLVQKLMSNVTNTVRSAGLTPIVWEEMLLDWNLTFLSTSSSNATSNSSTPDILIQVWQEAANLQSVLSKGYRALFGDYHNWYLDCGHGGFINPYPSGVSPPGIPYNTSGGVPTVIHDPFLDYCNPLKNWRHIYSYNPLVNITADVQHLIEGGEVHMWSEQTDPVNLDSRVWPRAAAAAEVMWSGPRNASMIEDASRRLGGWRERAVLDHGIGAGPVQMTWCLMEGGCNL
jgi:hexosaminidase